MVWHVQYFREIDSTNTWLVGQARNGADEGLVAFADFQSAGRGRLDRVWEAAPDSSLLCSVLLRPGIDPDELQLAVAAVALSLRAALVRLSGVRPTLKWPNDLLVHERKLAGVLAEVVSTERGLAVVVGFGVNLTASPAGAVSVRDVAGVTLYPRALLEIVLEELEERRWRLDTIQGRDALLDEYEHALATLGRGVTVELGDRVHVGTARAVDRSGRLVVTVDGVDVTFSTGDVVHVRDSTDGSTT